MDHVDWLQNVINIWLRVPKFYGTEEIRKM